MLRKKMLKIVRRFYNWLEIYLNIHVDVSDNPITVVVREGCVEKVIGNTNSKILDFDSIENDHCPTCSYDFSENGDHNKCPVCKIDWDNLNLSEDQLHRLLHQDSSGRLPGTKVDILIMMNSVEVTAVVSGLNTNPNYSFINVDDIDGEMCPSCGTDGLKYGLTYCSDCKLDWDNNIKKEDLFNFKFFDIPIPNQIPPIEST